MATKTILSLFDYSGNWSSPYKQAGYDVLQVDIKLGIDILTLEPQHVPANSIHGILAAPPCTDFASSGAQYWPQKDLDGRTQHSVNMVIKVLELVEHFKPQFWCLENPVGRLPKLVPQLKNPWYFNPHEFAGYLKDPKLEQYTKKTGLYGVFNKPIKRELPAIPNNQPIMRLGGKSERTKELRSMTPLGFAQAFFEANP